MAFEERARDNTIVAAADFRGYFLEPLVCNLHVELPGLLRPGPVEEMQQTFTEWCGF